MKWSMELPAEPGMYLTRDRTTDRHAIELVCIEREGDCLVVYDSTNASVLLTSMLDYTEYFKVPE